MARARGQQNGRLEEALTAVLQTQATMQQNVATLVQTQTAFVAQMAEMRAVSDQRWTETLARFARIEAILLEHSRILQALPDAVREKIGFKSPGQQT